MYSPCKKTSTLLPALCKFNNGATFFLLGFEAWCHFLGQPAAEMQDAKGMEKCPRLPGCVITVGSAALIADGELLRWGEREEPFLGLL